MTGLLLALTMCLTLDGMDLHFELAAPPVTRMDIQGRPTIQIAPVDAVTVRAELEARGFSAEQIAYALAPMRLLPPTAEVATQCGVCVTARLWAPPGYRKLCSVTNAEGPLCVRCKPCGPQEPIPVACGEAPTGVRVGR